MYISAIQHELPSKAIRSIDLTLSCRSFPSPISAHNCSPVSPISLSAPHSQISLTTRKINLKTSDCTLEFIVPELHKPAVPQTSTSVFNQCRARHQTYRQLSEPWSNPQDAKFIKKCAIEIAGIEGTFPSLSNPNTILALAAYLALSLLIDDTVETLSPEETTLLLRKIKNILNTTWTPDNTSTVESPAQSQSIQRLIHMTTTYHQYLSSFLSSTVLELHFFEIRQWLDSLIDEAYYRVGLCTDLPEYMSLRQRTMGLEPFWILVQSSVYGIAPLTPTLESLQEQLSLITGLQNDLVGLEKDIATADHMNCILVAAGQPDVQSGARSVDALRSHIIETMNQHNQATRRAIAQFRCIEKTSKNPQEKEFAGLVLMFARRYLEWMAASKRFKVES